MSFSFIFDSFHHALMITVFVFVMMLIVDYLNVFTRGKIIPMVKGGGFRQYIVSSFLGATPGCLGSFLNVSLYIRGAISFGAIVGGMIATSGDEAFVMLSLFPMKAIGLFAILFFVGILIGKITDLAASKFNVSACEECSLSALHDEDECRCFGLGESFKRLKKISFIRCFLYLILIFFTVSFLTGFIGPKEWGWERISFVILLLIADFISFVASDHYLKEHVWKHIVREHIFRVFLWSLIALLVVDFGMRFFNISAYVKNNTLFVIFIAGLIGIVPESGPHLVFVMMFARGILPFSVLLTSSIVQDGHGMLPLLSYSVRDSMRVKAVNFVVGILFGLIFYLFGL
jgi:hypothetical protein